MIYKIYTKCWRFSGKDLIDDIISQIGNNRENRNIFFKIIQCSTWNVFHPPPHMVPDLRVSVLYINFVSWLRFFSSVLVTDKQALYEHTDEYKWIMWKVYVWWTLNISKADALSLVVSLTNRQTLLLFPTQAKRNSSWCFCYITF